ncbi:uncharacterized protein BDW47DRAFT_104765 [Aspergillus candidus]|uniref:Antifungal protein n=1 Tax=Aspergillus candidus TaxID=41067 RepID=A0A2I2FDM7_ASPCN|nr:hypothetical protein BDW47DRAFT_104765 [Aspergillus candidus]PLB38732.1 hypothetical protein BDW47DRAFT_104765 [Aspergillus candidus]
MQLISLASMGLVLFAAVGAVASPMDNNALDVNDNLEVRDEAATLIKYHGHCSKKNNSCKFKGQHGKTSFCHCKFKKCSRDGNKCHFDSYSRDCKCI